MTARSKKGFLSTVSIRIDVPKTMDLLTQKIDQHNIKFTDCSSKQIKAAPRALAEKLVRFYKHVFRDWQLERMGLIEGLEAPSLLMNNKILAKEMTATDRTIRNYKKRLMELGFIEKSVYHGSKKPYELVLNMDFLVFQKRHRDGIWMDNVQIFPSKGSGTNSQNSTRTLLAEKSAKGKALDPGQRKKAPAQEPERLPEPIGQDEKGSTQAKRIKQKSQLLFSKSRPLLWPGQYFSQNECNLARENIAQIFRKAPNRLDRLFEIALYRCLLASAYWEREFQEKIPIPSAFFDPENNNGITATKNWLQNEGRFPHPTIKASDRYRMQTYKTKRTKDAISIGSLFNR